LEGLLLTAFAGRKLTMDQIYQEHSIGRPYIRKNYKEVLRQLEAAGKIITFPPAAQRRKVKGEVTFADDVLVTFPSRLNN
jgi:hypothetical protein